ncbi:hypothetical protein BU17DRAFT_72458 [Hysterangium stoloniferum]|nr:hypothetical protein BU17DRAFT_72458 [Hysterangium stoloniferum]
MPAARQSKSSVNGKKYNAKTVTEKISLKTLISTAKASKDEHGFSKSTLGSYERALHQARKWLQEQLEAEASFECPPGCPDITNRFNGKELKKGIAEQTYSAWKKFWDNSDPNGLYRGVWHWDPEKKIARGNPASAPEAKEIVKAVIATDAALGEWQHSAVMSKEFMDHIMAWSNEECPKEMLVSLTPCLSDFVKVWLKVTKHLFMNFELAKLQTKHYRRNLQTQDEYQWKYDECHLEQWKGWQHHISKEGDLESHRYEIHPQPDMPSVDMHFHMNSWIIFLETFVYGHELEPNDFIFPSVSIGVLQQFAGGVAGLKRDTLIRYLLDELYHYEEGHGDALHPIKVEKDVSFLNEHSSMQVPTLMGWTQIIKASLDEFLIIFGAVVNRIQIQHLPKFIFNLNLLYQSRIPMRCLILHLQDHPFYLSPLYYEYTRLRVSLSTIPKIIKHQKNNLDVLPGWKQAVDHWVKGDPSQNSPALKDWNPEWMKGKYKKMYVEAYYQHKVVALEFLKRFNGNEAAFLDAWPQASRGFSILFNAIIDDKKARGLSKAHNSKYSSPESRAKDWNY